MAEKITPQAVPYPMCAASQAAWNSGLWRSGCSPACSATFSVISTGGGVPMRPAARPAPITAVIGTVAARPASAPRARVSIASPFHNPSSPGPRPRADSPAASKRDPSTRRGPIRAATSARTRPLHLPGALGLELRLHAMALIRVLLVNIDQEIEPTRGIAEPGQQQCRLTAVLGGVVDPVQELLPERIGPSLALEVHVGDGTRQIVFTQTRDVRRCRRLDLFPASAKCCDVGKVSRVPRLGRRGGTPPFQPQPLGGCCVNEGVPDRAESVA